METKKSLVKIEDLYSEKVELAQENQLNLLLNQEPKKEWIKDHPIVKNIKYLPIERVEWMLTNIFIKWRVEVRDYKLIGNSVCVNVRLNYLSPVTNEWDYQDGLGAAPLQTDKDAGAIEFDKLKNDAVMKALPAAESYAVKDAAEKLGKLFGKDLNRADKIMYDTLQGKFDNNTDFDTAFREMVTLVKALPKADQAYYEDIYQTKKKAGELTLEIVLDLIKDLKK